MRWPRARLFDIASRIIFTASSASLATSCGKCAASLEINSDFVMNFPSRWWDGLVGPAAASPLRLDASASRLASRTPLLCRLPSRSRTALPRRRVTRRPIRPHSVAGLYLLSSVLGVQLGLQQRSQIRRSRAHRRVGGVLLDRLALLGHALLLDRQIDRAILAVDVDDHRIDRVSLLQMLADILHPVARHFRGAQVAFHVVVQRDDGTLGVQALDLALHPAALLVRADIVGEWIAFQLLDAERDALALYVDRHHHRLDLIALLIVAHRLLPGDGPGQVGQMHQTIDATGQPDEYPEVGD